MMRMFQAPKKKGEYDNPDLLVLVRVQFREYIVVFLGKKKPSLCDYLKCDKNLLQNIDGHVEVVILHR